MDTYDDTPARSDAPRDGSPMPTLLSLTEAATLLCVATSTLSQAARNGWQCAGYDVRAWAEWENDRIVGYHVPPDVVADLEGAKAGAPSARPAPDSGTYDSRPLSSMPDQARMPMPWAPQMGGYGARYAPHVWPPVAPAIGAAPAEHVAAELRRIIEDLHTQANRRTEDFERQRQALREDNERLRDELRRAQDQHVKEIRESERQLAKMREDAFDKRLVLREKLMDAQTDARLAEGGVENSALERLLDRYGDSLGTIAGAVTTAFLTRAGIAEDAFEDDDDVAGEPLAGLTMADTPAVQVTGETIAQFIRAGAPNEIEELVTALRADVSGPDTYRLAGETVRALIVSSADPSVVGARLSAVVADQFPMALSVPPSMAVQFAKTNGVVSTKAETSWLKSVVMAVQSSSAANSVSAPDHDD